MSRKVRSGDEGLLTKQDSKPTLLSFLELGHVLAPFFRESDTSSLDSTEALDRAILDLSRKLKIIAKQHFDSLKVWSSWAEFKLIEKARPLFQLREAFISDQIRLLVLRRRALEDEGLEVDIFLLREELEEKKKLLDALSLDCQADFNDSQRPFAFKVQERRETLLFLLSDSIRKSSRADVLGFYFHDFDDDQQKRFNHIILDQRLQSGVVLKHITGSLKSIEDVSKAVAQLLRVILEQFELANVPPVRTNAGLLKIHHALVLFIERCLFRNLDFRFDPPNVIENTWSLSDLDVPQHLKTDSIYHFRFPQLIEHVEVILSLDCPRDVVYQCFRMVETLSDELITISGVEEFAINMDLLLPMTQWLFLSRQDYLKKVYSKVKFARFAMGKFLKRGKASWGFSLVESALAYLFSG